MAGIGFTLKKMFHDESYSNRSKAYLYSALVAAGPWISAVITVNVLLFLIDIFPNLQMEKDLFMGTVVYSFIFSQIITAPWQMLITRYISDKLYCKEYHAIRPSFTGLTKIVFALALTLSVIFYWNRPLPIYYKVLSVYIFIILTMMWIIMVYLSAVKNYKLIAKAYIYGGMLSIGLTILFLYYPLQLPSLTYATLLLFTYLAGISLTFLMLLYNFLSTFYYGDYFEYDFIKYLDKLPSLFFIGLFYTLGLWIDDIIMWFSIAGVGVYETYLYAPIYDNAVFLSYLTIIPTMVLFLVSVETEFYDTYKKYYGLVNNFGTYKEIGNAKVEMEKTIFRKLSYIFQIQLSISVTFFLLAKPIFKFFHFSILVRNIFRVSVFGALFNILVLIIILILLYFESRKRALLVAFIFCISNFVLTDYFAELGLEYYGYGFTVGSLLALFVAMVFLSSLLKEITFTTFCQQPIFPNTKKGVFEYTMDLIESRKRQLTHRVVLIGDKLRTKKNNTESQKRKL